MSVQLFYILIGLLVAFGVISFLSLLRARHRRNQILREAERLGVLVPGVPGYVPMRDRQIMSWAKSDGSENPDWWDIMGRDDTKKEEETQPVWDREHVADDFVRRSRSTSFLAVLTIGCTRSH